MESERTSLSGNRRLVFMQSRRRAFVLVELMVALCLAGFVVSLVFYSWNYISRHTIAQQRKTLFQAEADRIAQSIATNIRKSPEVVTTTDHRIVFLSPGSVDTIEYELIDGALMKNNMPVPCTVQGAQFTQFSVEKENPAIEAGVSNAVMLLLTIGMRDRFGNAGVINLKVKATGSPQLFDPAAGKWNY